MAERQVRFGIQVAQMTGTYEGIRDAWLEADRLSTPSGRRAACCFQSDLPAVPSRGAGCRLPIIPNSVIR
ncbi:MAG: hypothetical protein M3O34_11230 [Chloroflexota bacterium]|nr:hypothetical protein [Chloroflexota bacterium]